MDADLDKQVEYNKPLSKDCFCKIRKNLGFIRAKDVWGYHFMYTLMDISQTYFSVKWIPSKHENHIYSTIFILCLGLRQTNWRFVMVSSNSQPVKPKK